MDVAKAKCAGCDREMEIRRLECPSCGVVVEGRFELSPLARLSSEDQIFVQAFVKNHGSIKQMERLLGISYPTVKNRLHAITARLEEGSDSSNSAVLEQLARGEITVDQALERLS